MAEPTDRPTEGEPPRHIHIERKKTNWLAWLLLALGLLALLFALSRCGHRDTVATTTSNTTTVVAETPNAPKATALASTSGLAGFLGGTEATPRTFTFDTLNFETGKSDIRAADAVDVNDVASTLSRFPNTRIRIAGYADTRGNEGANVALGKARADSVKAALVAKGIAGDRIETATGGTSDPVDTNATAAGRAENRRTELVVTQR